MLHNFLKTKILLLMFLLSACASGNLTVIQRFGGNVLTSEFRDSIGETEVIVTMPNNEVLKGRLTWIPPGGTVSTALLTDNSGSPVLGAGMTSGSTGMYIGTIVGDHGTTMRIELLCNTWTGKCVGVGKSSKGEIYDIQR